MPTQSPSAHLPFGENKQADWYGKDIISVKQFSRDDLEYIFGVAHEMRGMVERVGTFDLLKGKILANLFYEPSTRTSSSFTAAMERLGGSVIPINEVKYSSVTKGETLADTVRTVANICENFRPGETYNIGGNDLHSIEELSAVVLKVTGASASLVHHQDSEILTTKLKRVDTSKSVRDLDHKNSYSLEDGMRLTADWMRRVYQV